ncbi:hypothetical protein QN372_00150 [Undibacterium sp. RTI2.1]|uniref:hypothetical protein n=1 Tax=unclassified Undibacterium TaxID=2630295 RepID=UPI002AB3D429|nr:MULTISPECIES: hypothetical protein [unclassified Undibacterium]MDY7537552.1 hypothetical protein [Undibacterium sp. 5I1]MEB0029149.1 hypothetical protein [Undibacterium sp. RTI2.1]MEB0115457.1 hypothetical protein [Undibacterium sp. RTI2.2]MEB0231937.1 hypothetical protein [Undibacterium sp. 10I3]MEB0256288.1 hypothetical protein [Undibacterium sp. 5I1]
MDKDIKSPIKSGWRNNINGYVEGCVKTEVKVSQINLSLDQETAWALCNLLCDSELEKSGAINRPQFPMMSNLGAALGRMIDHSAANNSGRKVIKT